MRTNNPFYKIKRWKRKRLVILTRDNYLCRECKRYGRSTEANTVHHIYTRHEYPEYKWHNENLISLCDKCHESMHNRFEGKLTDKGKKWMERIREKLKTSPLL